MGDRHIKIDYIGVYDVEGLALGRAPSRSVMVEIRPQVWSNHCKLRIPVAHVGLMYSIGFVEPSGRIHEFDLSKGRLQRVGLSDTIEFRPGGITLEQTTDVIYDFD